MQLSIPARRRSAPQHDEPYLLGLLLGLLLLLLCYRLLLLGRLLELLMRCLLLLLLPDLLDVGRRPVLAQRLGSQLTGWSADRR